MKNGIYKDITIEEYHANDTHISATQIKQAKNSLKEFHWRQTGKIKNETKTCFDFGNAFELALLDRDQFSSKVAIMQDELWVAEALKEKPDLKSPKQSKSYQTAQSNFLSENQGKYIISGSGNESYETIEGMLESCYQDKVIQKLITGIETQLSLFWTDDQTGLNLKTRPDFCKAKKNVVVNLKTADCGEPDKFSKEMANYDYPLQACMEITGCVASGLMPKVDNYFWLVVEKKPPYNATIYEFAQDDIKWTMDCLDWVLRKISEARKKNFFPGYTDRADNQFGILTAKIPLWYQNQFV